MRDTTRNCTNCKYPQENTYPCNECNLYDHDKWEAKITTNNPCEDLFKKAMASLDFANWVASEIMPEIEWVNNRDAFPELACRRLEKLGIVKEVDGEWVISKHFMN